jgi:hypothetical protein
MKTIDTRINIKSGKPHWVNKKAFLLECSTMPDMEMEATFEKKKSKRTVEQNRLWWVYMTIMGNELGYTKDEMHEIAGYKLLKAERVNEKTGEVFEYIEKTSKLSKSEFSQVVDFLIIWAAEMKIELHRPDTQFNLL